MDKAKKRRLEAKGWKVGSVDEFLSSTAEEDEAWSTIYGARGDKP